MCGFIVGKNIDSNLEEVVKDYMGYRGLPEFVGYQKLGSYQWAHISLPFTNLDPDVCIQPNTNSRGDLSLFVGEIFNWKELDKHLYGMEESKSDGRFIADYYTEYGLGGFHKFDGFWSFVTLKDHDFIAVTDFLGIKPIYYRTDMEAIASEIDALVSLGDTTLDELFLSNTLKWGYDPTGRTPYNQIKQVPPGHYYYRGEVHRYWNWDLIEAEDLQYELREAVRLRLGGEREVSVLLSGGLDSTIIYGLIKDLGHEVKAIHVDNHEESFASLVSDDLINVTLDEVSDEDSIRIHQSPVDLGSVKPQIAMARKLRELGFYAVMTGDGADELFGGYRRAKEYDSQYSDVFCELPFYHLPKLDRTMMEQTIELRAPFLAPKVIKYALNLPYEYRQGEKVELKRYFKHIVPQPILDRDKHPLKTDAIRKDPMQERIKNVEIFKDMYEEMGY